MNKPSGKIIPQPLDQRQRGFSIVAAIFILVALAVLGTYIVSVTSNRSVSLALDLLGSRAYQAARAGIEWNAYQIVNPENTNTLVAPFTTPYTCPATANISGMSGVLAGFTASVSCTMNSYTEAGNTVRVFQVVSTACNDPSGGACPNNASTNLGYVERQITTVFATCRLPSGASC